MLKIKDDVDLKELEKFGFKQSHVAVYPKQLVKVVDWKNKKIIEICDDEKNFKEIWLWNCKVLKKSNSKILIAPDIKEHLYYEKTNGTCTDDEVKKYINDLITAELIEKRGLK